MAIESSIRQKQTNNGVVEMLNKTKTGRLAVSTTPRQRLKRRDGESTSRPGPTHAQGRNPPVRHEAIRRQQRERRHRAVSTLPSRLST